MSIRIVNLRNVQAKPGEIVIRCDRKTVVGNPFFMHDESERDKVCDQYEAYFQEQVKVQGSDFRKYVTFIYQKALKQDVALACWCAPKRCHTETIKRFIEKCLAVSKVKN